MPTARRDSESSFGAAGVAAPATRPARPRTDQAREAPEGLKAVLWVAVVCRGRCLVRVFPSNSLVIPSISLVIPSNSLVNPSNSLVIPSLRSRMSRTLLSACLGRASMRIMLWSVWGVIP